MMTTNTLLFGVENVDLVTGRAVVEKALDVMLIAHSSDYRGGDYFRLNSDAFTLVLQSNFVEDDGETTEADFPAENILLFISGEKSIVDKIRQQLPRPTFKLLRLTAS